jgi:hypothetical protein
MGVEEEDEEEQQLRAEMATRGRRVMFRVEEDPYNDGSKARLVSR